MIPKDPAMLLSYVNMKLRDQKIDLEELCGELMISKEELTETLSGIDYHYNREQNQFK